MAKRRKREHRLWNGHKRKHARQFGLKTRGKNVVKEKETIL